MPRIELRENIELPAALTGPEVLRILREIERGEGAGAGYALKVSLEDLHLPDLATFSVPLDLKVSTSHGAHATRIDFHFAARKHSAWFPVFTGSLRSDAMGPARSILWFVGDYEPPLGKLGAALDATVMRGIAERTLRAFLKSVADAAEEAVRSREESHIRTAELNR